MSGSLGNAANCTTVACAPAVADAADGSPSVGSNGSGATISRKSRDPRTGSPVIAGPREAPQSVTAPS
jgi:hypothetical protein